METVKLGLLIKKTKVARCGEHSYPVLSITKQDGIIMQSEKFKKRIASADTSDYKIIPRGKLVQGIHIDEGNFGIQDIVDNGIVSPAYGVWDVNDGLVIPKYLEMVLRSPKSIEFYRSKLTGTVNRRGHMSDADFLSMDIPLPDRDTQSKILKTMKQTTSVLYSRQQQLAKLDELIKARFVEMFGDCRLNPKGWVTKNLDQVADVGSSKRVFVEELQSEGIPFYRGTEVGALAEGKSIRPELFITEGHYKQLCEATGKPQKGDLLMPSICPDGRIWVVDTDAPFYFKDGRVLWVHLTSQNYNPVFLLYTLKDRIVTDYESIASGTTFAELKIFALKKCRIFDVPLSLQNQFADFVAEVDKSKVEVQKALDQTQLLFDSLMQQYFG